MYRNAENAAAIDERGRWIVEARRAAADMGALVAMRSPQTVARMEIEMGLR